MKKAILLFALWGSTTVAFAQVAQQNKQIYSPETRAELQAKRMALDLDLDDKQQKKVETTLLKQHQEMQKMRAERKDQTATDKAALSNARLDAKLAFQKDMQKILNKEQYAKWKADQAKKQANREMRMHATHKSTFAKDRRSDFRTKKSDTLSKQRQLPKRQFNGKLRDSLPTRQR